MNTVYLIFTRHKDLGACNVANLLNTLNRIKPEVIFEELEFNQFDLYYLNGEHQSLESDTVKRYRAEYPVIQVPVDVLHWRDELFLSQHKLMFNRAEGQNSQDAFHFRNALDSHQRNMKTYGFPYLNSHYNDDILNEIDRLRRSILEQMNDPDLLEIDRRMDEIHQQRELTMIQAIYDYAAAHTFETGVFYVGSAHRRSILRLIEQFEHQETTKIEWVKYLG